ncbi:C-signal-like isoform X2 [Tachypleus tridentatus]|uniref:C-signal-like isoform X2 n=1 Tax=Tachypleus tridentatus TaxID=6853 RepID=UPI003FD0A383
MQLGSNIFITGTNRGIGLEIARQLTALIPPLKNIFASCRKPEEAKIYFTTQELQDIKHSIPLPDTTKLHIIQLDVTKSIEIEEAVKIVKDIVKEEGLNLLINNAGICRMLPFPQITPDNLRNHIEVNSIAPLILTEAFYPLLKTAASKITGEGMSCSRAAVVNMSSTSGSLENTNTERKVPILSYKASKTALNMLMRGVAMSVKRDHILVVMLCPGWVQTNIGGPRAFLRVTESVESVIKLMATLNSSHHGRFFNHTGLEEIFRH